MANREPSFSPKRQHMFTPTTSSLSLSLPLSLPSSTSAQQLLLARSVDSVERDKLEFTCFSTLVSMAKKPPQ
ncbi:hypothetical protein BASA81_000640 [Batrachochytrium salamandrivorans]|nr:hypothetical protein BASA81_000640 [Batrachochytrium salamandrivorans]